MKVQAIISDLTIDGEFPVSVDMYLDIDRDLVKLNMKSLNMELCIRLVDILNMLGDELHG